MHQSTILVASVLTLLCILIEGRSLQYQNELDLSDAKFELTKRLLELMNDDDDEYLNYEQRLFSACSCTKIATKSDGSSTCLEGGCPAGCGISYNSVTGICSGGSKSGNKPSTREFLSFEDLFNF